MSSFIPLNVYPDSDSDGEVDNTREIQIEEALKLYQRALKLHTDGEWEEAHRAYDELFSSDIFQGDPEEEEEHGRNSASGSSLPLVLYLAYKNHGAFKLDRLNASGTTGGFQDSIEQALGWFATALGRDSGDPSLWRKAAQLALVIDSPRLARFSLESVLDHETVGADSANDTLALVAGGVPNPEEHLASLRLRDVLRQICDAATLESDRFQALSTKKLHPQFEKFINPYPWLPLPDPREPKTLGGVMDRITANKQTVVAALRTWPSVGAAILSQISNEGNIEQSLGSSSSLQIIIPSLDGEDTSRETTPDQPTPTSGSKSETTVEEGEDIAMTDASAVELVAPPATGRRRSGSATRKRKSASLGAEGGDAGRSRLSKRQRDKKEADAAAAAAAPEAKQKVRQETQDEKLFNTADECFLPLGVSLGTASALKYRASGGGGGGGGTEGPGARGDLYLDDFRKILQDWDDDKGNVVLYDDGIQSPDEAAQGMAFLDMEANVPSRSALIGDEGLRKWVNVANARGPSPQEAGFEWLKALCMREVASTGGKKKSRGVLGNSVASSWIRHSWPEALKEVVIAMANACEEICWNLFKRFEEDLAARMSEFGESDYARIEWAQTIFEIFLEDLAAGERQKRGAELPVRGEEELEVRREKVKRWSYLVRDLMYCRPRNPSGQLTEDQLTLRYLWATAVFTAFTGASREFRLECFDDLKGLLSENSLQSIELPNSSVMPEISAQRAEREISKLKTVDFFTSIFRVTTDIGDGERDPLEVIEILEAILEPGAVSPYDEEEGKMLQEIGRFLEGSSAMFRLHLWEKLKMAYEKVGYRPKVLSCVLRSIEVLVNDWRSKSYVESAEEHRHFVLLRSLRLVEEMLPLALALISGGVVRVNMAEIEKEGLVDAMKSIAVLLRLLHCYAFWEDAVANHEVSASNLHSYRVVVVKFREMMVRAWVIMYLIYREAIERGMGSDNIVGWEAEGEQEERLASLLRDVHEELGARHYCKLSNHVLLRLVHDELLRFDLRDFDHDLLQCIHCRFHLAICSDQVYFFDHKTDPENLDKVTAMQLMDFTLLLASRKKVLQLQKSDIRIALEKLFEVVGAPRKTSNNKLAHNEAVIDQYLRGSIRPLRLFHCLRGEGCLSTVEVGGLYSQVTAKGLYFTLGKISLYPLRYQKKTGPIKGDDIYNAIRFFKYDLTCNASKWETWYRLGQAYETQMDDGQTWNADLINARRGELVTLERKTILCYMRALCLAIQHGYPDDPESRNALSSLYADFGNRIYSAVRPPMDMESFSTNGYERHYSGTDGQGMYKEPAHKPLRLSHGLKIASILFQNSLIGSPDNWKTHYMIGKCMGKLLKECRMFTPEAILEKYVEAVEHCPDKVGNDHIFEPHHKLVSSAWKYVLQGLMEPKRACEILEATHFTKRLEHAESREQFVKYILETLRRMRAADKPKWHHRMTNRAAQLKLHELRDVAGAKAEIANLFSNKQVSLSIWRPENERTGRHFVYASKYTTFYASLLERLDDRTTLEGVAKKVRKTATGFFRHTEVWTHVFIAYIMVLRRTGDISDQTDEEVFRNVSYDEFNTYSHRLDTYCNLIDTSSPTLDLLREVFELRRLNAGLAKTPLIDDLLADTYAKLYSELVPEILKQITTQKEEVESTRANPMSLKNLMSSEEHPAAPSETSAAVTLAAAHSKLDDLPIRGKMTKVTKRELVSKACNLCKAAAMPPPKTAANAHPTSPKLRGATLMEGGGAAPASPEDTPMGSPNDGAKDSDDEITSDLELSGGNAGSRMDEE